MKLVPPCSALHPVTTYESGPVGILTDRGLKSIGVRSVLEQVAQGRGARLPLRCPGIGLLSAWGVSLTVLSRPHPIETFPFLAIYDPAASRRNGAGAVSSPAASVDT